MPRLPRIMLWLMAILAVLLPGGVADAQAVGAIELSVAADRVGLGGVLRPGGWMPMEVGIENRLERARRVRLRWHLEDEDGDRVLAEREVTLSPGRAQRAWLYAPVPRAYDPQETAWRVSAVDLASGAQVAMTRVFPGDVIAPGHGAVGIVGHRMMGLDRYAPALTQQEPIRFLTGLEPGRLPDRWYGLSMCGALIWTPGGGSPDTADFTSASARSLRRWVRRGGHLVVIWPEVGQRWTQSPLADLLPEVDVEPVRARRWPWWLGQPLPEEVAPLRMNTFRLREAGAVLLRGPARRPVAVAVRRGFGRVTLLGLDVSSGRLARMKLPHGPALWGAIFGWTSPAYSEAFLAGQRREMNLVPADRRRRVALDRFVPRLLAMRSTVATVLVLALAFFGLYWLTAGPVGHYLLKRRGRERLAWPVFALTVVVFAALAWGGALLARPGKTRVVHFSVVDIDAAGGTTRMRSWLNLFVPRHGPVELRLGSDAEESGVESGVAGRVGGGDLVNSAGWSREAGAYLDPRTYRVDAAGPGVLRLPFRATSRRVSLDHHGPAEAPWGAITGHLERRDAWPSGTLEHELPGPLEDVLLVYAPGDGTAPWVWRPLEGAWPAGEPLAIEKPARANRLVVERPSRYTEVERDLAEEGYLGRLMDLKTGVRWAESEPGAEPAPEAMPVAAGEVVQSLHLLSFFDRLPPPRFVSETRWFGMQDRPVTYRRTLGRGLDLSPLTAVPAVMVIGQVRNRPLPAPLRVNGAPPERSTGWTMVRWISDLPQTGAQHD